MKELYKSIHSPKSLLAFEAAARLSSFTRAAEELNVSQPAISLSVKKLEKALGVSLFERRNRVIRLTETGERFYTDVSFGLMHILRSSQTIAGRVRHKHVTIKCSTAFAHYWMIPRLAEFKKVHPKIDLRLQVTERDGDDDEDSSVITYWRGPESRAGYNLVKLASERIFAIASPNFLQENPTINSINSLVEARLLHLDEPYRLRPAWKDWFAHQELDFDDDGSGLRFNDYALVLQACLAGEGVAMGWEHVTSSLIKNGFLRRIGTEFYDIDYGFYACWPATVALNSDAVKVLEWLELQTVGS